MISLVKNFELKMSISKAALILGFLTLISRIVGLLRDRIFASKFGAGDVLDSYYAAFRIPDLVFNLLILGTLSVAFIPVFTELLLKDRERAYKNANTILNASFLTISIVCLVLFIFSKPLTHILVPGFQGQKLADTILLTKLFLISPVIFTVSNVFSSILNSQKKFIVTGIAPILYNLGIIFGLYFLYPKFGIKGLGFGVLLGALVHLISQIPEAVRFGYRWKPVFDFEDEAFKKIRTLFLPRIFGVDNSQVSLLIGSIIGSILVSGSITVFNLANNLQAVPIGIFAISAAVAAFPALSEHFAKHEEKEFAKTLAKTITQILFFMIPISIMLLLLRAHIVRLAFGAGKFDWVATKMTLQVLGIFSFALFSQGLSPLLSRAFYARQNTIIPVAVNLLAMLLNSILAYFLGKKFGIAGVAAGFSFASILNVSVLFILLRHRVAKELTKIKENINYFDSILISEIWKICLSSIVLGLITYAGIYLIEPFVKTNTGFGLLIQSICASILGLTAFLIASFYVKLPQTEIVFRFLKRIKIWN